VKRQVKCRKTLTGSPRSAESATLLTRSQCIPRAQSPAMRGGEGGTGNGRRWLQECSLAYVPESSGTR
jgi:hypothetical protein